MHPVDVFISRLMDLPHRLTEAAFILVAFTIGALVYCYVWERRRSPERLSFRGTMREIFRPDMYKCQTSRADIFNAAFVYTVFLPVLITILTLIGAFISAEAIRGGLVDLFGPHNAMLTSGPAVVAVQTTALFLGGELGVYVGHLMLHKVPLLWALHRVHHSAESLTPFTRFRDHPLDLVFFFVTRSVGVGVVAGSALFLTGTRLDPAAMGIIATIGLFTPFGPDLWRHCHIPISFGWLNRIFNAPVMHQIHHSAELRHRDKNLGGDLMIFDWLFGTLYVPKERETYRWGLNDDELGENNPHVTLRGFYLEPLATAWQVIRGKPKAEAPVRPEADAASRPGQPGSLAIPDPVAGANAG